MYDKVEKYQAQTFDNSQIQRGIQEGSRIKNTLPQIMNLSGAHKTTMIDCNDSCLIFCP